MAGRFSISFPGRRDRDDPWFRIGTLDVTTSVLVPMLCVVSMFVWAASPSFLEPIVLFADDVRGLQVWRLLTWPLANEPGFWTALMLVMLWYFGREIERMVGRARYMWLLVLLAVVPGLAATLFGVDMAGARALQIAVFCVFCAELPDVRFFGGIPAWVFAAAIVGLETLQLIGLRREAEIVILLVSLATAALAARSFGLLSRYAWIPHLGGVSGGSGGSRRRRHKRARSSGGPTVVTGPWPTGLTSDEQRELDGLLDKTSADGLDALSRSEKARLNELSKKLRSR